MGKKPQVAPYSGAMLRDGRAVGDRDVVEARSIEFDETADDALLAQHLRDGQHEVGRSDAFLQISVEPEADDLRDQHADRLAEHGGLGFDPADAPAEHAQPVDHGRVAVRTYEGIGISDRFAILVLAGPDALRDMLQVHLVADPGSGRHHLEIVERVGCPT